MSRFSSVSAAVLAVAMAAATVHAADSVSIVPTIGGATTTAGAVTPLTFSSGNTLYVYTSGTATTYTVNLGVKATFNSGEEFGTVLFGIKPSSGLTLNSTYTPDNSSNAWLSANTGAYNTVNGSFGPTPGSLNEIAASVGAGSNSTTQTPFAAGSPQAQVGLGASPTPVGSIKVSWDGSTANQVLKVQDPNGVVSQLQFASESTSNGQIGITQSSASPLTVQFAPQFLGDFNFDGVVNALDLSAFGSHWQQTVTGGASQGDFNGDGIVNALDLSVFGGHWQQSWTSALPTALVQIASEDSFLAAVAADPVFGEASPAAVPEPASLGLLALGGIALLNRRRKA